jgi:hypothetical protein
MKKRYLLFVMLFIFIVSTTLFAQPEQPEQKIRFGMGVAMGKEVYGLYGMNLTVLDFPSFYLPIQFGYFFRLEPEFGYYRYEYGNDIHRIMLIGCGSFLTNYWGAFNLYYGTRVGLYLNSGTMVQNDIEVDYSSSDWVFAPTIGAECCICKRKLSLGGEIQFNYVLFGKEKMDSHEAKDAPKIMKTKTLFFIRWYFGE